MYILGTTEEYELNDVTYYIKPIPPFKAQKLLGKLQKIILPSLLEGFGSLKNFSGKSIVDSEIDTATIAKAFSSLSDKLDGDTFEELAKDILRKEYVTVKYYLDGKEYKRELGDDQINILFSANMMDMYKVILKVLQVTYGDFFTVGERLIGNLSGALSQVSQKQESSAKTSKKKCSSGDQ